MADTIIPNNTCNHCWHTSEFHHMVHVPTGRHVDEYCCLCGKVKCETIMSKVNKNHGPFLR